MRGPHRGEERSQGQQSVVLSVDAISEFKMLTGTYQAEYGRSMGGQISMVFSNIPVVLPQVRGTLLVGLVLSFVIACSRPVLRFVQSRRRVREAA